MIDRIIIIVDAASNIFQISAEALNSGNLLSSGGPKLLQEELLFTRPSYFNRFNGTEHQFQLFTLCF